MTRRLKCRAAVDDVQPMMLTVILVVALAWPGLALMTVALCAMAAQGDRERPNC